MGDFGILLSYHLLFHIGGNKGGGYFVFGKKMEMRKCLDDF